MKSLPIDESKPIKELSERRMQRVVKAFLTHPEDKEKQLKAIQEALELNAKELQSERQKEPS